MRNYFWFKWLVKQEGKFFDWLSGLPVITSVTILVVLSFSVVGGSLYGLWWLFKLMLVC